MDSLVHYTIKRHRQVTDVNTTNINFVVFVRKLRNPSCPERFNSELQVLALEEKSIIRVRGIRLLTASVETHFPEDKEAVFSLQVYDPSAAYLGPPVFYAPQAYTAVPGQFRFPPAKAHVGGRGLIRTPSVRGEDSRLC